MTVFKDAVPGSYSVYVIELDRTVSRHGRFRRANPDYRGAKPCVYVGSSTHLPDVRFDQHKEGYKSNRFVQKYGTRLLPELYEKYNTIPTRDDAVEIEAYLARRLRQAGYGVWSH